MALDFVESCEPIYKRSPVLSGKEETETQYWVSEIQILKNWLDETN